MKVAILRAVSCRGARAIALWINASPAPKMMTAKGGHGDEAEGSGRGNDQPRLVTPIAQAKRLAFTPIVHATKHQTPDGGL